MSEITNQKRPASHRWAIGLFGFMTAGFAIFLLDLLRGRSGAAPGSYLSQIFILTVGAVGLVALVFGKRRRWAYYVGSGALAIWSARGAYSLVLYFHYFVTNGGSISTPYFNLAERDQPFVVQENIPLGQLLLMPMMFGLLIWLFTRFAFGRPSRANITASARWKKYDAG